MRDQLMRSIAERDNAMAEAKTGDPQEDLARELSDCIGDLARVATSAELTARIARESLERRHKLWCERSIASYEALIPDGVR